MGDDVAEVGTDSVEGRSFELRLGAEGGIGAGPLWSVPNRVVGELFTLRLTLLIMTVNTLLRYACIQKVSISTRGLSFDGV